MLLFSLDKVEFEATVGGWTGDIAIDKIEFTPGKCPKGALTSADVPKPTPTQSSSFVGGRLRWQKID